MFDNKTILAIIPARGGSKGLPKKNSLPVMGKPLMAWSIMHAKASQYIDRLICSSEDAELIAIAKEYGCEVPFIRPEKLAQDNVQVTEVVIHAIESLHKEDYTVLLQPTSPLILAEDIDGCIAKCIQEEAPAAVTISEPISSPFWMYSLSDRGLLEPIVPSKYQTMRRQDFPKIYEVNGGVYVARTDFLLAAGDFLTRDTVGYIMPTERAIDVDTSLDLVFVETMMRFDEKRIYNKGANGGA